MPGSLKVSFMHKDWLVGVGLFLVTSGSLVSGRFMTDQFKECKIIESGYCASRTYLFTINSRLKVIGGTGRLHFIISCYDNFIVPLSS